MCILKEIKALRILGTVTGLKSRRSRNFKRKKLSKCSCSVQIKFTIKVIKQTKKQTLLFQVNIDKQNCIQIIMLILKLILLYC